MQFRFREYDEKKNEYKLLTYVNIKDYAMMFKTLTYMSEHQCDECIEFNEENLVEALGSSYQVVSVALCIGAIAGDDTITPHFVVDVASTL